MAHHYIAQFLPQEDGTFCVFFPDLEGCNTFGDTLEDAFEAARDAATGWLEVEMDRGAPLPAPSDVAAAKAKAEAYCRELDIDVPEGTLYQLVPVDPQPEKPVRVNMTFAPRVLRLIDRAAEEEGLTRSGFLAAAAKAYIRNQAHA